VTRVLVITTEPLPLPGQATTGAGLRAWGLCEGLRGRGFDALIATPVPPADGGETAAHIRVFARGNLAPVLAETSPDVVVLQHWGIAAELPELHLPLVIDLAGPHLLERLYWGTDNPARDLDEKIAALRRADFVTCSGEYQRHYFYGFLQQAAWDLRNAEVPVIPFSIPPDQPAPPTHPPAREFTFIYGGAFLAWQDPTRALTWLLDEMDCAGRGRLLFYGGAHPVIDASAGKFAALQQQLASHPRVEMRGWKGFDELLPEYATEGDVAVDLMSRNPERELAFTTRTMVYLHCGLPVLYNNYSEVSGIIVRGNCGWTLDPDDEPAFRRTVAGLLSGEVDSAPFSVNARATAAAYTWDQTIGPLADFCAAPRTRPGKLEHLLAAEARTAQSAPAAPSALVHFKSRYWKPGRILAPFVYLICLPVSAYIWLRLRNTVVEIKNGRT